MALKMVSSEDLQKFQDWLTQLSFNYLQDQQLLTGEHEATIMLKIKNETMHFLIVALDSEAKVVRIIKVFTLPELIYLFTTNLKENGLG